MSMNPKAIVVKQKKKLRCITREFNKKSGEWEIQLREGGSIVNAEPLEEFHERFEKEYKPEDHDMPLLKDLYSSKSSSSE